MKKSLYEEVNPVLLDRGDIVYVDKKLSAVTFIAMSDDRESWYGRVHDDTYNKPPTLIRGKTTVYKSGHLDQWEVKKVEEEQELIRLRKELNQHHNQFYKQYKIVMQEVNQLFIKDKSLNKRIKQELDDLYQDDITNLKNQIRDLMNQVEENYQEARDLESFRESIQKFDDYVMVLEGYEQKGDQIKKEMNETIARIKQEQHEIVEIIKYMNTNLHHVYPLFVYEFILESTHRKTYVINKYAYKSSYQYNVHLYNNTKPLKTYRFKSFQDTLSYLESEVRYNENKVRKKQLFMIGFYLLLCIPFLVILIVSELKFPG